MAIMDLAILDKEAYWSRVERTGECWLWTGRTNDHGYGIVGFLGRPKRPILHYAHRVAWALTNGPIPPRSIVMHSCDVRACINPAHLILGTRRQNSADMVSRGRSGKGEAHSQAILTEAEVRAIRACREAGWTQQRIADGFGVSRSMVGSICLRKRWAHVA